MFRGVITALLLLFFITDVRTQFFDFASFQPLIQYQTSNRYSGIETTTKRTKTETRRQESHTNKTISVSFALERVDEDGNKEKQKRKQTTIAPLFNFDFYGTTAKPTRKSTKSSSSHRSNSTTNSKTTKPRITIQKIQLSPLIFDSRPNSGFYEQPLLNNIAEDYFTTVRYDTSTKQYSYPNNNNKVNNNGYINYQTTTKRSQHSSDNNNKVNNNFNNYYNNGFVNYETTTKRSQQTNNNNGYINYQTTTKRPKQTTNNAYVSSQTTKRPQSSNNHKVTNNYPQSHNYNNGYRPTDNYNRPTDNYNRPTDNYNRPTDYYNNNNKHNTHPTANPFVNNPGVKPIVVDNRPPITNRPVTKKPSYLINPRPTDAGSIAFPDDEINPEIITGPNEDDMSEAEKRRYIDMAEKMCDKYKALNTKRIQAIPLVPSPEPVQISVSDCAPANIPLVVGGKVVTVEQFPHMALLGWRKLQGGGYSWKCGGSLISEQYVLTAAHCAYEERDNTVVPGPPRAVQLGSSYLDDPGALVVKISTIVRHPKYKSPKSYFDLALIKLVSPVTFSEVIKPACLGVPPEPGSPIIATGWGRTESDEQSLELRSVSLPVWDIEECYDVLGTSRKLPSGPMADSQMCAGERKGGKDTCQGDSGGPAQIQDGCVWRVVAVTSLGRSCGAPHTPGLYAIAQRAFIASQVFGGQNNKKPNSNNINSSNNNNNNYYTNNNQRSNNNSKRNYRSDTEGSNYNNTNVDFNNARTENYNNNNQQSDYRNNDENSRTVYSNENKQNNQHGNQRADGRSSDYNRQKNDYKTNDDSGTSGSTTRITDNNNSNQHGNRRSDENHSDYNNHNNQQSDYNRNHNGYRRQGDESQRYFDTDRGWRIL